MLKKPWEKRSLPSPARLGHAVNGLFHAAYKGPTVGAEGRVFGGRGAVNHFTGLQLTLEVGGHKDPTAHAHAVARSDGCERAQRRRAHRSTERLIIVNSVRLGTALHAETCFHGTAPLPCVYPDESHERPVARKLRAISERPAAVCSVVGDFGAFSRRTSGSVVSHGLLARPRVSGNRGGCERATMPTNAVGRNIEATVAAPRWKRVRWVAPSAAVCSRSGVALSGSGGEGVRETCSRLSGVSPGASRELVGTAGAAVGGTVAGCAAGAACNASDARGRNAAMARAMTRFKSGGYAADGCDVQEPSGALTPPHRAT
eukprot:6214471-Pleurochrysis_carterae.AAC.5